MNSMEVIRKRLEDSGHSPRFPNMLLKDFSQSRKDKIISHVPPRPEYHLRDGPLRIRSSPRIIVTSQVQLDDPNLFHVNPIPPPPKHIPDPTQLDQPASGERKSILSENITEQFLKRLSREDREVRLLRYFKYFRKVPQVCVRGGYRRNASKNKSRRTKKSAHRTQAKKGSKTGPKPVTPEESTTEKSESPAPQPVKKVPSNEKREDIDAALLRAYQVTKNRVFQYLMRQIFLSPGQLFNAFRGPYEDTRLTAEVKNSRSKKKRLSSARPYANMKAKARNLRERIESQKASGDSSKASGSSIPSAASSFIRRPYSSSIVECRKRARRNVNDTAETPAPIPGLMPSDIAQLEGLELGPIGEGLQSHKPGDKLSQESHLDFRTQKEVQKSVYLSKPANTATLRKMISFEDLPAKPHPSTENNQDPNKALSATSHAERQLRCKNIVKNFQNKLVASKHPLASNIGDQRLPWKTQQTNFTNKAPPTNTIFKAPPTDITTKAPPTNSTTKAPSIDITTKASPTNTISKALPTDITTKALPTNRTTKAPSTDIIKKAPFTDINSKVPPTDITQEVPPTDIVQKIPSTHVTQKVPPTDIKLKPPPYKPTPKRSRPRKTRSSKGVAVSDSVILLRQTSNDSLAKEGLSAKRSSVRPILKRSGPGSKAASRGSLAKNAESDRRVSFNNALPRAPEAREAKAAGGADREERETTSDSDQDTDTRTAGTAKEEAVETKNAGATEGEIDWKDDSSIASSEEDYDVVAPRTSLAQSGSADSQDDLGPKRHAGGKKRTGSGARRKKKRSKKLSHIKLPDTKESREQPVLEPVPESKPRQNVMEKRRRQSNFHGWDTGELASTRVLNRPLEQKELVPALLQRAEKLGWHQHPRPECIIYVDTPAEKITPPSAPLPPIPATDSTETCTRRRGVNELYRQLGQEKPQVLEERTIVRYSDHPGEYLAEKDVEDIFMKMSTALVEKTPDHPFKLLQRQLLHRATLGTHAEAAMDAIRTAAELSWNEKMRKEMGEPTPEAEEPEGPEDRKARIDMEYMEAGALMGAHDTDCDF